MGLSLLAIHCDKQERANTCSVFSAPVQCSLFERATGKHGNAGTETGMGTGTGTGTETTERSGERESVSSPYSPQESQMSLN